MSSSVMNFIPWTAFLQTVGRRWFLLLLAMFYDDASMQDISTARGRGQRYLQAMFRLFGVPLAAAKSSSLSATCDFLGLVHNLEHALTEGRIAFVPRERVGQSYTSLLDTCLEQEWCDPQQANKLRGIKAFTSLGQYGSVGRIGLAPLAQRQYSDQPPWQLSGRLRRGLQFLKMLDTMMPPRDVFLWKPWIPPLVVASDGRVDDTAIPSAGVCLYAPLTDAKYAWCMELCSDLCLRWRDRHCIMEVEAMPVVTVVLEMCELFRGRDIIWYIDNVAALSAFVKGGSEAEDLDRAAAVLSLAAKSLTSGGMPLRDLFRSRSTAMEAGRSE